MVEPSVQPQPTATTVAPQSAAAVPTQPPIQQQPQVAPAAAAAAAAPVFSQAGYPQQQQMGFPSQPAFPSQTSFGPQQPPMSIGSQLAVYHPPSQFMGGQPFQQPAYLGQQTPYGQPFYQNPPPPPPPPAPAPQQPKEDSTNTALLSETRHQTTEVRMELTKLTSKIEDISGKVSLSLRSADL